MRCMTQAHSRANWSGVPTLSQLWLAALLRVLAMSVSHVANVFRMLVRRLPRECHTDVTPHRLPARTRDIPETSTGATEAPATPAHPGESRDPEDDSGFRRNERKTPLSSRASAARPGNHVPAAELSPDRSRTALRASGMTAKGRSHRLSSRTQAQRAGDARSIRRHVEKLRPIRRPAPRASRKTARSTPAGLT